MHRSYATGCFVVLIWLSLGWFGCTTQHLSVGGQRCALKDWQADDYFTQDVLPGMESNLRKQRIYVVVGSEAMGFDAQSEWLLAVDSVLIPMRLRTEDNGAWQWSGSRNFYQSVREGVMSLDEEHPSASGLDLSNGCFMIQRGESGCRAVRLPMVRDLGVIAMP